MDTGNTNGERAGAGQLGRASDFFDDVESDLADIGRSTVVERDRDLSARLEKTEHRLGKLEMLIGISRNLNSTLNLNELLEAIVDSIIKLVDSDRGFLMLADRGGDMRFRIARDREEHRLEEKDFEVSYSIINDAVNRKEPLFLSDLHTHDEFKDKKSVVALDLRTAVCVPIVRDETVIGVIYTDSHRIKNEFSPDDISVVGAFASQAASAIENARLHGELILSRENLERENLSLRQELSERYEFSGIIGKSKSMIDIFDTITKIAPHPTTVLIQGETGTGKELIARAIHFNGPRKTRQLVTINCGAMPEQLLESELFGHVKGSFTGAVSDKKGLFETASGGTIFLDEIGDMPVQLQVKLLRVLQEGEIRRVGDNTPRRVDVRVIAATNRDLAEDVKTGRFRQDLFYRLNVVPISIPPLRDRVEDILPLIEHFLRKYTGKMDKDDLRIVPEAIKALLANRWTGNVRELENSIERAVALSGESHVLTREHFADFVRHNDIVDQLGRQETLKQKMLVVEKRIITEALRDSGGKVTQAAGALGVTRQHLHNKIRQHEIKHH